MPNNTSTPRVHLDDTKRETSHGKRLLIPATETQRKLGDCSPDTVWRLEREGVLTVIRLRKGGRKYHRLSQVEALAMRGVA